MLKIDISYVNLMYKIWNLSFLPKVINEPEKLLSNSKLLDKKTSTGNYTSYLTLTTYPFTSLPASREALVFNSISTIPSFRFLLPKYSKNFLGVSFGV